MATLQNSTDSKEVQLIHRLVTKTREGRIEWRKQGKRTSASLPDNLVAYFEVSESPLVFLPESWTTFVLKRGNEAGTILELTHVTFPLPNDESPPIKAASELYRAVRDIGTVELDKAMKAIETI